MKNFQIFIIVPLIFGLSLFSCRQDKNKAWQADYSNDRMLFVDYVASHTGGVVSVTSAVRVKLTRPAGDSLSGEVIKGKIFSFDPALSGKTWWEDDRTVAFLPDQPMASGQTFDAVLRLDKIIPDLPADRREFRFNFKTLLQNFDLKFNGLEVYDKNNLTRVMIRGQIQTADRTSSETLAKMIRASQDGRNLEMTWQAGSQENQYEFTINEVRRTDKKGAVLVVADGSVIGAEKTVKEEVSVPALDDFSVISSAIVRGIDQYISVRFSDPLDERQELTGLVSLTAHAQPPRLVVNLNELKIYPTSEIPGATDLVIHQAVKNAAGFPLRQNFQTTLEFTQIKPEVRWLEKDTRSVLPASNGLVLPFEAAGLRAVDLTIVRIFENNVLQYLQNNELGTGYELYRVGKRIARQVIPLNTTGITDLNPWNRFTLNLEEYIKPEPGAFYQVKIGFKKDYSLYFCGQEPPAETGQIEPYQEETGPDEFYEDYYYDPDYDWEERENPCSGSYYGGRRTINRVLFASDLGLIAKRREGGPLTVFVTSLLTTEPLSGVDLEVYNFQQQKIATAKTGQAGHAEIPLQETPFVVVARQGSQTGYLKVQDGSALSLSNFDVSGEAIQSGIKGFIYGERGVWRPADTLHIGFILEKQEQNLPGQHPVIMELYNPSGQLMARQIRPLEPGPLYRFDFVTAADAPTGNWLLKAKAGGAGFQKTVKIETIKPNRLKIGLDFKKERLTSSDRMVGADLNVHWLSGAAARNLKTEYELQFVAQPTLFKNFPGYQFDDPSREFHSERQLVFEGRLNESGYARLNFDLGDTRRASGALLAKFYGRVYEAGGDFSTSIYSIPYLPFSGFVGIKAPEGDQRRLLLTDQDHVIQVATVDGNGNPVSRQNLQVALYKVDWRWWWDNSYDYQVNYIGSSYHQPVATDIIRTVNGKGQWKLRVNAPDWGRFFVQVSDPLSGHSTGQFVYLDWPGWAGKGDRGELDGASMLDFNVEKEAYVVGEEIRLSVPSTKSNRILVSLETGSRVVQSFWAKTDDEAQSTTISFEATAEMAPNIYVHLSMIQPHAQTKNDLPIRLYGVQSVKVVDKETVLQPLINLPAEIRPGQRFTVSVGEANKKPMTYTVAIVDEGLLDITNFKTPDPWTAFNAREALGIKTFDLYDQVVGSFGGRLDNLLSIGGDDEVKPKDESEANRFKPVVKFIGPFKLEAGKTARHHLIMPQYIGSVKTMVVAASGNAFGSAEKTSPVRQPLMVLATLPRVAGPGETMKLPVNVFAMTDQVKKVKINVEAGGPLHIAETAGKEISFSQAGDQVVFFDIETRPELGKGTIKVQAVSGEYKAVYDIELNILPRNPQTVLAEEKILEAGESWMVDYQPLGLYGRNSGMVEVSTLPPLNLEQRLNYLIEYPHGCIEQTVSAGFAQLHLNRLTNLSDLQKKQVQQNVQETINRLKAFQLPAGGLSYWPGNDFANLWGSNYAAHFLIEAGAAGYAVPEGLLDGLIRFQKQKADNWGSLSGDEDNDLTQAYRLFTLAKAGSPALGAMNRMKEKTKMPAAARWRLALTYAVAGYADQAKAMISGLPPSGEADSPAWRYTYGSVWRDQAMILETLTALGDREKAFRVAMELAKALSEKNNWMSTQTTAYNLIALAGYTTVFPVEQGLKAEISQNEAVTRFDGEKFVSRLQIAGPEQPATITVKNQSVGAVYARLLRTGIPLQEEDAGVESDLKMDVRYLSADGHTLDVHSLIQGTNFTAEVTITHPGLRGEYSDLALTQIFPSGWEIINTRLDESETGQPGNLAYKDIRDDRVLQYFHLQPGQRIVLKVLLNAAYMGRYYLPSVNAGAMYDNTVSAAVPGQWVEVTPAE